MRLALHPGWFALIAITSASSCLEPPTSSTAGVNLATNASASPSPVPTAASGPRAAKIIFKNSSSAGSFDSPANGGTVPVPGSGLQATRVFNADGSLLASGGTANASWPQWLSSFEIGISGTSNTAATNSNCARFADSGTDGVAQCALPTVSSPLVNCGAPSGYLRVSEYDCVGTNVGNGGPNDGVFLRANFNRNPLYLGATENILAVLEYSAWAVNPPPRAPTSCFINGRFDPTALGCSDLVWQMYMKHSPGEVVQPYMFLVPPAYAFNDGTSGSQLTTRQIVLPIAGDPNLQVFQISRVTGPPNAAPLTTQCAPNSAQCVGMVLYSITFFRI